MWRVPVYPGCLRTFAFRRGIDVPCIRMRPCTFYSMGHFFISNFEFLLSIFKDQPSCRKVCDRWVLRVDLVRRLNRNFCFVHMRFFFLTCLYRTAPFQNVRRLAAFSYSHRQMYLYIFFRCLRYASLCNPQAHMMERNELVYTSSCTWKKTMFFNSSVLGATYLIISQVRLPLSVAHGQTYTWMKAKWREYYLTQ